MAGRAKLRQTFDLKNKLNNSPDFAFPFEKRGKGWRERKSGDRLSVERKTTPRWEASSPATAGSSIRRLVRRSVQSRRFVGAFVVRQRVWHSRRSPNLTLTGRCLSSVISEFGAANGSAGYVKVSELNQKTSQ